MDFDEIDEESEISVEIAPDSSDPIEPAESIYCSDQENAKEQLASVTFAPSFGSQIVPQGQNAVVGTAYKDGQLVAVLRSGQNVSGVKFVDGKSGQVPTFGVETSAGEGGHSLNDQVLHAGAASSSSQIVPISKNAALGTAYIWKHTISRNSLN